MSVIPLNELIEVLEELQEYEKQILKKEKQKLIKGSKKNNRNQIEAQIIQMEYDLKAKHNNELDELEETGTLNEERLNELLKFKETKSNNEEEGEGELKSNNSTAVIVENSGISKKEKAQKKKEKKEAKKNEKEKEKQQLSEAAALLPSNRVIELQALNNMLRSESLEVFEIDADGHCLYRSVADQLKLALTYPSYSFLQNRIDSNITFADIRHFTAQHMRNNSSMYAPFLGLEGDSHEYSAYCDTVDSVVKAEWGGQLEINAICSFFEITIWVYEANKPILKMGEEFNTSPPLRLAYHRHYYSLGEHYNSIQPINSH